MKAALVSLGSKSSRMIADALAKYFDSVDNLRIEDFDASLGDGKVFYDGQPFPHYDCIYLRGSYRYANLLSTLTILLKDRAYLPLSHSAFRLGHDKLLTHLRLQAHNIPQPRTYLVSTANAAKKVLKQVTFPVILKLPGGTHGKGVMIAESADSAKSMMDVLALLNQPFLVQEYIETGGTDIRALVVGDKVIAAMKRRSGNGESRANIHAGGSGERIAIDSKTANAAIAAARACRCDVCAVDLLQGSKGPLVLEINLSPGLQGITKVTNIDVADRIAKHLYSRAKERRSEKEKAVIKEELASELEIHTGLDFRGNRILLPEIVTKGTKFTSQTEVTIKIRKGKLEIEDID